MNAVPCIAWVRRGAAQQHPEKNKLTPDQLSDIIQKHGDRLKEIELGDGSDEDEDWSTEEEVELSDTESTKVVPGQKRKHTDEVAAEYKLEGNDDEDEEEDDSQMGLDGIACYGKDSDDPYLSKAKEADSDDEELEVLPEDSLVCIGKVSGDFCNLEVHLYNEADHHWYCHHDIMLGSFPIALEWINFDPIDQSSGNLVAVGFMEPDIEIWDIDVIDCVEPAFILAGQKPGKKKKKKKHTSGDGHSDAVLSLAWNQHHQHVLASASADSTVCLWDLAEASMANRFTHHKDKVQTICWHPSDTQSLLSGSYDKTAQLMDCRYVDDKPKSWTLPGEVEQVLWNPHSQDYFVAGTDTGHLYYLDRRMDGKAVFTLNAHSDAVTSVCFGTDPELTGFLMTCSADKSVKVWDISDNAPKKVMEKDMKLGTLYCAKACPDSSTGMVFAVGGESELKVLNLKRNVTVCEYFNIEVLSDAENSKTSGENADADLATTSSNPNTTTNRFLAQSEKKDSKSNEGLAAETAHKTKKKKVKKNKSKQKALKQTTTE